MNQNDTVIYNGKPVPKQFFRAYVYGVNGAKKLVNSWDEFEKHIKSCEWFESVIDVPAEAVIEEELLIDKPKRAKKSKEVKEEIPATSNNDDYLGFEVKQDDFLPNEVS